MQTGQHPVDYHRARARFGCPTQDDREDLQPKQRGPQGIYAGQKPGNH
jgi:hypothetical protein